MSTAIISLCKQGAEVARRLADILPACDLYLHDCVETIPGETSFPSVVNLTDAIFGRYPQIIYVAPCGVATRAIAPKVRHKLSDPAVVVVDVGARWAVSLLSGHEGGANQLTIDVGNALDAEPIVTTTTEAAKSLIIGLGCRRGTPAETIVETIQQGLAMVDAALADVRYLSSAKLKSDEAGLLEAGRMLGIPIRFISELEIRNTPRNFNHSSFVSSKVDLPAVAEPCALLAGRKTTIILCKTIINGTTIAIARESFLS